MKFKSVRQILTDQNETTPFSGLGLEPPKPARVRPEPKPKAPRKTPPSSTTLCKPPRVSASRSHVRQPTAAPTSSSANSTKPSTPSSTSSSASNARTLQVTDLSKLARLNCSREFSLFHQFIKPQLSQSYENQLGFLQTKLQHLKNDFVNKQAEHLNFEQIRDYYDQAVREHVRRRIKPDEYLTLADKLKQDSKQVDRDALISPLLRQRITFRKAIDKWLRKKEFKPQKQITEFLQKRQARIRDRIKETLEEAKKQQQQDADGQEDTESRITISSAINTTTTDVPDKPIEITTIDDDDVMIID